MPASPLPGFLATTGVVGDPLSGVVAPVTAHPGPVSLTHWGLEGDPRDVLTLSRVVRTAQGRVPSERVRDLIRERPAALTELLPPFAAAATLPEGVVMVADSMGFRPLYLGSSAQGRHAMSTSALLAGRACGAGFDQTAVAVQSLLGWQLGQRTLSEGVLKLEPGAFARLSPEGIEIERREAEDESPIALADAVRDAAASLRESLEAVLDDHPDAVLQLTGGQDSRLLLSAIPAARRRGLRAMTLDVPGGGDVAVASQIAQRYGLDHEVRGLADLDAVSPAEAWERCCAAAILLDGTADPVALAAIRVAEQGFEQGVRISGLGGEVARGFYYVGRVRPRSFGRRDAERLASWRMFANEAVEPGLLDPEFSRWGRDAAMAEVFAALQAGGDEWFRATDALYLRHRMQRWAGATDMAVAYDQVVINPMLDPLFLRIAGRLRPQDKAQSRFLALLQMELDAELGDMPLEGRPAPRAFAHPTAAGRALQTARRGRQLARKAFQRARRGNRAPAGGQGLAGRVVRHWRDDPSVVARLSDVPFVRPEWVADVLSGAVDPRPSSVAFLTNILVADQITGERSRPAQ